MGTVLVLASPNAKAQWLRALNVPNWGESLRDSPSCLALPDSSPLQRMLGHLPLGFPNSSADPQRLYGFSVVRLKISSQTINGSIGSALILVEPDYLTMRKLIGSQLSSHTTRVSLLEVPAGGPAGHSRLKIAWFEPRLHRPPNPDARRGSRNLGGTSSSQISWH